MFSRELNASEQADLDEFAARVRHRQQVDLESLDEAELLAIQQIPMPYFRLQNNSLPAYLGLTGTPDEVLASAESHPDVVAAGARLAGRGLAARLANGNSHGYEAKGDARIFALLRATCTVNIQWASFPVMADGDEHPKSGLFGSLMCCRWKPEVQGLCLVQTASLRDGTRPNEPVAIKFATCAPEVGARHVEQSIFRQPLTPAERQDATGVRTKLFLAIKGHQPPTWMEFWRYWDDPAARDLKLAPGPPPRRGFRGRGQKVVPGDLAPKLQTMLELGTSPLDSLGRPIAGKPAR